MKFWKIDKKALDTVIGETYGLGDYTLRDELKNYNEDIIFAQYLLKDGRFEFFQAWSEHKVFILIDSIFGDKIVLGLARNPPPPIPTMKRKKK
jgi:hypothetical protein